MKQLICSSLNGMSTHQTVLAAAKHSPDRDADPLEGIAAGSWRLGIVGQSQGRAASDCGEADRGDVRGDSGGEGLWRKAGQPWKQGDTAESRVERGTITMASPPICQRWQMNNREAAALKACRTHLQRGTARSLSK